MSSEVQNRKSRRQNARAGNRKKVCLEALESRLLLNAAPVATADTATLAEDTPATINVLANDTDADGDVLSIASVSAPAHGAVAVNADKTLTYTPAANFNGTDAFTYKTSDAKGGISTATVNLTVTAVNDAPVAVPDFVTTAEDTPVTLRLLANDYDVDGDALYLRSATMLSHGTFGVYNAANQTLVYTPNANFHGTETFTYTMRDTPGLRASALVTITVGSVNDVPVAAADAATTAEDTPVTIDVLANDSDPDAGGLTISALSSPAHGTVVLNADKTIAYTPAANFNGTDAFTYTIRDAQGDTSTATVNLTVTPVNDAPVAVPDFVTTAEDTPVTLRLLANDYDVDGDALYLLSSTMLSHGTFGVYNAANQTLVYTPNANFRGTETFTYTMRDTPGLRASALVTITVTSVNDVPVAAADAATTAEDTPVTIDVLANDSDPDGGLTISALSSPAHGTVVVNADKTISYTPAANYYGADAFTYTIRDAQGDTSTATVNLTVTPVNDAPVAVPDFVTTAEDTPVTLRLLANDYDVDGDALYLLSSTMLSHGTFGVYNAADHTLVYTPNANFHGTETFTYTMRDTPGLRASALVTITVTSVNDVPVAAADVATTAEDTPVTIDVLANDSDPDGGLTISAVSSPAHGTVVVNADKTIAYTPSANYYGADAFSYTIRDAQGDTSTATVNLTVTPVNDAPVAVPDFITTAEDTPVTLRLLANDYDVDGDGLTLISATLPFHGTLSNYNAADQTVVYTPNANFSGTDTFTYNMRDTAGLQASALVTITVTPANTAPVANADSATTAEDTPVTINVLANDSDADGDALVISAVSSPAHGTVTLNADKTITYTPVANFNGTDAFTYTVNDGKGGTSTAMLNLTVTPVNDAPVATADAATTAEDTPVKISVLANDSDADGDALVISAISSPAHGTVTLNADKTITYTPAANFNGTDAFTYTVNDGKGGTSTATVNLIVTAVNDKPVANPDFVTTAEDTPVRINFLGNDYDVDGDTLYLVSTTTSVYGTLSYNASDKSLTYTPGANFNGTDTFTYSIRDQIGLQASALVTITVTPVNDAPVATADAATTAEDTPVTIDVLANDSDADGDALVISAVSSPAHGTVTLNADKTITYTPAANFNGTDAFTYTVNDGKGGTSTAMLNLTVAAVNDAPVAQDATFTTTEDTPFSGSVVMTDIDSSTLTAEVVSGPASGALVLNADGSFTYTPNADFNGTDAFTYLANDGSLDSNVATVTITVGAVNDSPVLGAIDNVTITEGQTLVFAAAAIDVDAEDTLTYALQNAPTGASIDASTGVFTWTPTEGQGYGQYDITVLVLDNGTPALTDMKTFTVTVMEDTVIDAGPLANDGTPDIFRLIRNGDDDEVFFNETLIFSQALSSIADLSFIGSADDDTLIIDTTGGNPAPAGGISFNGDAGADSVALEGAVSTVAHAFTDATSGTIGFDGVTQVTYSNTEALADNLISSDKFLVYGSAADQVTLTVGETQTSATSTTNPALTLTNPGDGGWLTLMTNDGNDVINLINNRTTTPAFNVILDAGAGSNKVYDRSSYAITRITGTENADTIRLNQTTQSTTATVNTAINTLYGANRIELIGLGGDDRISLYGSVTQLLVDGGEGDDTINAAGFRGNLTALGGGGNDNITGSPLADVLIGGAGDDTIAGGAGDDLIAGGGEAGDVIDGGTGSNTIIAFTDATQYRNDLMGNVVIQQSFWLKEFTRGSQIDPNDQIRISLV